MVLFLTYLKHKLWGLAGTALMELKQVLTIYLLSQNKKKYNNLHHGNIPVQK